MKKAKEKGKTQENGNVKKKRNTQEKRKVEEKSEGLKRVPGARYKGKNFNEYYGDRNERRNKQAGNSYFINMESTILELLLDNNLESYKNAGKLLFIILSGISSNVLYLKRVLSLVHLFFLKGGNKFYHSIVHLNIAIYLRDYIKLNYVLCCVYIYNLLLSNNNIKDLEKYKDKYEKPKCIVTCLDFLYFYMKDFMMNVRDFLIENALDNRKKNKDIISNITKEKRKIYINALKHKICLYKENNEEIAYNIFQLFNCPFTKNSRNKLKRILFQCTHVNYPLHSIYLDMYILQNIRRIVKVLVMLDLVFSCHFPYYYFFELKLKLLLLNIHTCYGKSIYVKGTPNSMILNRNKKGIFQYVEFSTRKLNNISSLVDVSSNDLPRNDVFSILSGNNTSSIDELLPRNENDTDGAGIIVGERLNEVENSDMSSMCSYSLSDSSKSDSEIIVEQEKKKMRKYKDEEDEGKNFYLDKFMNLYSTYADRASFSLPSVSDLQENNPLKLLNKHIRTKRKKIQDNSSFVDINANLEMESSIVDFLQAMGKGKKTFSGSVKSGSGRSGSGRSSSGRSSGRRSGIGKRSRGKSASFVRWSGAIKASEKSSGTCPQAPGTEQGQDKTMERGGKKRKLSSVEDVEDISKNTYTDIFYNISLLKDVAKYLMVSSHYDPIYIKLFYCYLLPFISFEKRIEIFLIYSYSNYKIWKPLIFIIFYNNYNSTFILNTIKTVFKDKILFEKYKNTYYNGLSLRNVPKNYFVFMFLLSIFFYDDKAESLLYMHKIFYHYDSEIINDQEQDINYKQIFDDVILENDKKYIRQKKNINIIIIKFIEMYQEKFNTYLCNYFDFYRIFFVLYVSCVNME
ncbi:conserved Plasmodium protein, unknown function [Plasmodium ovale]|uniref:Uncharacterized protein n=1 Tax=Plasmodium ovale TaxID=36330 RepID=A0A1D3TGL4_PLAOA|nr:conserved Plasmodium protein, unknown function [Plasmodium ovale]